MVLLGEGTADHSVEQSREEAERKKRLVGISLTAAQNPKRL